MPSTRKGSENRFPLVRLSYTDDTPATPTTGQGHIVAGADKLLRWIDDEGTLYNLATPGAPAEILDSGTAETDDTLVLAPDGAGGVEWRAEAGGAAFSGCRGVRSASQSITADTWTAVSFTGTDTFDTNAYHDPGGANPTRFVAPSTGYYEVKGFAGWQNDTDGVRYSAFAKNGTRVQNIPAPQPGAHSGGGYVISDVIALTAGDYIELHVYAGDSGNSLNVTAAYLTIRYLGA